MNRRTGRGQAVKVIELLKSKEWSGKVIDCVLRFALSFALALAQVFGGYAPLALGMIGASGAGLRGVSALIGASAGAVLFLPFSHALRTFAAGVLIFTANNAFFDLKLYKKRAFLPLLCAGMMFSVEFVYVLRDGVGEAANCLMALLLCALGAMSGRALLSTGDKEKEDHPYAPLFILLGVLMAASSFETADGFAPGRILSMLAVLLFAFERGSAFAIPAALCIGLGMDLGAGGGSFVHAASYAFSAVLVNVTARGNRVLSALWFALSILCFALPMNAHAGLVLLYEGLAATLLFLLIPSRFLRGKRLYLLRQLGIRLLKRCAHREKRRAARRRVLPLRSRQCVQLCGRCAQHVSAQCLQLRGKLLLFRPVQKQAEIQVIGMHHGIYRYKIRDLQIAIPFIAAEKLGIKIRLDHKQILRKDGFGRVGKPVPLHPFQICDLMQVPGYTVVRHSCSRLHVSGRKTEKLWPRQRLCRSHRSRCPAACRQCPHLSVFLPLCELIYKYRAGHDQRQRTDCNGKQLRRLDSVPFAVSMGCSSAAIRTAALIFPEFFSALWTKHDTASFSALLFHLFYSSSLPYNRNSGKTNPEKRFLLS